VSQLEAFWLGIVQGLSEFLPVSSSGHLLIFQSLLGIEGDGGLLFEIALHVATLLAIVIFFHRRILALIVGVAKRDPAAWRYVGKLALATLPVVFFGLFARSTLHELIVSPVMAGCGLLLTGAILWTTRRTLPRAVLEEPAWEAALLIGLAQALAILPGVSRSGSTVAAALALGVAAAPAAEFSFLLGIVAISGAAVLALPELAGASPEQLGTLAVGCASALASGIVAIWLFVLLLRRQSFHNFAYYTWSVGSLFLVWLALR
jgi:undecaprenyl-diphosphatase